MKWLKWCPFIVLWGCGHAPPPQAEPLEAALNSPDPAIRQVMEKPGNLELQVLFTQIHRERDSIRLEEAAFGLDSSRYFYPASTVKLPVAVLALEKLGKLDSLDLHTRYFVEGDTLEHTFAGDIKAIFAVSDNDAHNRLVEFLSFDSINNGIRERNLGPIRISQRLGGHPLDPVTKPLIIYLNDSSLAPGPAMISKPFKPLNLKGTQKGKGYMEDGKLVQSPFDFSLKNYYPLHTQHEVMKHLILPELFPAASRFKLQEPHRQFLLDAMKSTPRNAGYNPTEYPDGYGKFFMYGDTEEKIPGHLEIYNKAGWAYGTLTDCAYIRDTKHGVEFFLSATLLVNPNGVFNDDQYAYEQLGIPFLAALGRAIHTQLVKQKNHEGS